MNYFVFFYNNCLTLLFGICAFGFLTHWLRSRERQTLWAMVLFVLYLLDNIFFAMLEFIPEFIPIYREMVHLAPYLNNLMSMGMLWCFRMLLGHQLDHLPGKKERLAQLVLLVLLLTATALAGAPGGRLAYALLEQGVVAALCLWSIRALLQHRPVMEERHWRRLYWLLVVSISLHIGGAVECIVPLVVGPKLTYRIFSYELFGLLCTGAALAYLVRRMERADKKTLSEQELIGLFAQEYRLTPRESELLPLLIAGEDNATISRKSWIAHNTVKVHAHNIYQKLGVERRAQVSSHFAEFKRQRENE